MVCVALNYSILCSAESYKKREPEESQSSQCDVDECPGKCAQRTAVGAEPEADSFVATVRQFHACWNLTITA